LKTFSWLTISNAWLSDPFHLLPHSTTDEGADIQNIQLQEAFLNGMEPLLGVPRRKGSDTRLVEDEQTSRHVSVGVEQEEEKRLEEGIGAGGVFGDRTKQVGREGIERTVWEFREEGQRDAPVAEARDKVVEVKATPASKTESSRRIGRSVYRFVDKTQ
jgi:hypothetical protein